MIRTTSTELRIGQLKPTYLDITFTLAIDIDGVDVLSAELRTDNGPGPVKVRETLDNPEMWWDLLAATEQDEMVNEILAEEKNPADEWDFNDNGFFRR